MTGAVAPRARPRLDIGKDGLYLATFMAVFDIAVVYLALPSMERSIGASLADQVWIASAYGVTEAGFTLAAGTLGDLYGRRRIYVMGIVLFTLASIASGLAPTTLVLIVARFIQGIGGAIMMALPLAILVAQCKDRSETFERDPHVRDDRRLRRRRRPCARRPVDSCVRLARGIFRERADLAVRALRGARTNDGIPRAIRRCGSMSAVRRRAS